MRKRIITLFGIVATLLLVGHPATAQPQGDYTRVKNLTPRELMQKERQFRAKYPIYEFDQLARYPMHLPIVRLGEGQALQVPLRAGSQKLVYGSIMSANNWSSYDIPEYRVWSFPLAESDAVSFTQVADASINANGGGVCIDGTYHVITTSTSYYSDEIYTYYDTYNTKTWAQLSHSQVSNGLIATDLAYDPTTDMVYGCFYTDDLQGFELASINFSEGFKRSIVSLGTGHFIGLAVSNEGQLYGIAWNSQLYKIDKRTGAMTLVGPTGITFDRSRQSAFFDEDTDQMYFSGLIDNNHAGLYAIDTTTGHAALMASYPHAEQLVGAFIPKAAVPDDAPYKASGLKANFAGNSTTGTVSFTMPDETVLGDDLEGAITYELTVNGQLVRQATAQPGKKITVTDVTVENGQNKFSVVCSNSAGRGEEAKLVSWIGYDEPLGPSALSLNIAADGTATLAWSHPTQGIHGKAVDAADLTYTIVRYPDQAVVATGVTGTTFTDHIDASLLRAYYYMVTPFNHGIEGVSALTAKQAHGDHLEIPFTENFDESNALDFFTIVDANADGNSWDTNTTGEAQYSSLFATGAADDWLITPPLQLFADRSYRLSFRAAGRVFFGYTGSDEQLAVSYGRGTSPADLTDIIMEQTTISGYDLKEYSFIVRPAADGNYSFGFHATSPKLQSGNLLLIDDLAIELNAMNEAPAEVQNLTVTAAPKGLRQATISFTAPTQNSVGQPLAAITAIEVYRNGSQLIHTFPATTPGTALSCDDSVDQNGLYSYTVVALNDAGRGVSATAQAFIGIDRPLPPTNVTLIETGEDEVTVSWTPPTMGVNGGYVDPDELTYRVQRSDNAWMTMSQKGATSFKSDISSIHLYWKQENIFYNIHASSESGESDRGQSNTLMAGNPYGLPFVEDFSSPAAGWENKGSGRFRTTADLSPNGNCMMFTPDGPDATALYLSPKLSIEGAVQPGARFSFYAYPGADAQLTLKAQRNGNDGIEEMGTIRFHDLAGAEGWRDTTISITGMDDARYVRLHFAATAADGDTPIAIDELQVRDMVPYNVEARLAVPRYMQAGQENRAYVKVANIGARDARNFKVQLFAGGDKVAEAPSGTLPTGTDSTYTLIWKPELSQTGVVQMHAVAEYALDADTDDNTTPNIPVVVEEALYPTALLTGETGADGKARLAWTEPVIVRESTTDDFEQYPMDDYEHFGNWTTWDEDEGGTYKVGEFNFPGEGDPMSWILFNTDNGDGKITAHSGKQFLFSVSANYIDAITNGNWLISPQLSGEEQTISFWYRVLDTKTPETMRILYSRLSNHPEDFTPLDTIAGLANSSWEEYSIALPKDAKFFAIEYITPTINPIPFAVMVDDITYEGIGAKLHIEGYRIWRDGVAVATVGTDVTEWTDEGADGQIHTYAVTVVYGLGESGFSNEVMLCLTPTEIGAAEASRLYVGTERETIVIRGANGQPVSVATPDGKRVYSGMGDVRVAVAQGQYVVSVGSQTVKLQVRR